MTTTVPSPATGALPGARPVRAPRGTAISCRGWPQEAALRMLMNNLDPEVAENPDALVVYGGTGRAARSWAAFDAIVRELQRSGRRRDPPRPVGQAGRRLPDPPVGAAGPDRELQPRREVGDLGALPGAGAGRPDDVRPDDGRLLDLHRDAGDPPGNVRDVRRARPTALRRDAPRAGRPHGRPRRDGRRAAAGRDDERGRRPLRGGRRGPGTAPPRDRLRGPPHPVRSTRRWPGRGRRRRPASRSRSPWSGTPPRRIPSWSGGPSGSTLSRTRRRAHDALGGYVPAGVTVEQAAELRRADPDGYIRRSMASMADHVRAMLALQAAGAVTFDYGNNIRAQAQAAGVADAFDFAGFVPLFIRPQFCEGRGPFRWVALSGDPADILRTDEEVLRLFPDDAGLRRWITHGPGEGALPGTPGPDLLARLRRAGEGRPRLQRARPGGCAVRARSSSGATTSTPAPSPRRTARRRRCATGRMRSRTGRSSTPWSTPPPGRPG